MGGRKTILCVDDDKQIRELIQTFLEGAGYRVVTSPDGWSCLRDIIVKQPDLILLDVNMPKLDGLNTLDLIKVTRMDHRIPVILVSGEGDRETIVKAAQLGADDFVVKPFSFEDLAARIAAQLYTVDYPSLAPLMALLTGPETKAVQGLDLAKYPEWKAHTVTHENVELCVLLQGDLDAKAAGALKPAEAMTRIVVMKKTRVHWKQIWPLLPAAAASVA